MKRMVWLVSLGFVLVCFAALPASAAMTGMALLTEIQNGYQKTNDLEAQFVQEYSGKMMRIPQKAEGKVYLKKKGMMRWDYRVPNQKLISNGSTLWFYQPEEKQVFVSDVEKVLKEKTPLAFLAGEGDLRRDFKLLNFNEAISQKEDHYVVELAPVEQNPMLAKLVLTVDKKNYYVVQADVIDSLGNVTRTRFLEIKTNVGLSPSFFQFTIPPGTEVLQMKEPSGAGGK